MSYGLKDLAKDYLSQKVEYVDDKKRGERLAICEICEHISKVGTCKLKNGDYIMSDEKSDDIEKLFDMYRDCEDLYKQNVIIIDVESFNTILEWVDE